MTPRLFFVIVLFVANSSQLVAQNGTTLSLDEAISIALRNNPEVLASQFELEARQARFTQSGAIPNPELVVYSEDFAGSGLFEGFGSSQTTVQLGQKLELGGKREARQKAASLRTDVAAAEIELKRREITSSVRKQFFFVLLNQQRVRWMQDLLQISKQFSEIVIQRIQAGKIPPIDQVKASSIVAMAEVDLTRSKRDLESARYDLASVLGTSEPHFQFVHGQLPAAPELSFEAFMAELSVPQEIKIAEIQVEESQALLAFEKSKSVPDLTISGGYRWLEITDDSAFVAGVALPLPFFDRNKGGIAEAQKRLQKSEQVKSTVALQLRNSVSKALRTYNSARTEAEALQSHVLPANQTSFDAINEGYRLGKYGYLEMLEAQRSLFQARLQLLHAQEDLYESSAELERITGKQILTLMDQVEASNE